MGRAVIGTAIFAGLWVLTPGVQAAPESELAEHGRQAYRQYCESCHGPGGRGDGLLADALKAKVPDLTQIAKANGGRFPRAEIMRVIDGRQSIRVHGQATMPVWGERLALEVPGRDREKDAYIHRRVRALVRHLESIQAR
jgi:mono/diheme cytochrome c family protein